MPTSSCATTTRPTLQPSPTRSPGKPHRDGRVALDKTAALALEASILRAGAPSALDVSTESFGYGPIEKTLRDALARGARVRLIVAAREVREHMPQELDALARLTGAGIRVREDVDKLAVAPDRAWIGSANATASFPPSNPPREWGISTDRPDAVAALEARFAASWATARPYVSTRMLTA